MEEYIMHNRSGMICPRTHQTELDHFFVHIQIFDWVESDELSQWSQLSQTLPYSLHIWFNINLSRMRIMNSNYVTRRFTIVGDSRCLLSLLKMLSGYVSGRNKKTASGSRFNSSFLITANLSMTASILLINSSPTTTTVQYVGQSSWTNSL